ncbi:hypothetical protein BKA93DRAFT_534641 [Sparassis latifolia]|uniref:Autophagy-related protein 27 n=1 Tax=Sparassis crispa TaxID=139825 RepID=A0A401GPW5_9APHY|nr:predicted protein [Sparassis crispa]GBE84263.1 predicted protein [Sparassis crispa]
MILAAALLALCWSLAAAAADVRSLDSLAEHCRFSLGNQRFNLCPVFEANEGNWVVEYEVPTPPTFTKTSYTISLRGALQKNEGVPDHEQCPDGSWICMITSNRRLFEEEDPRVLQVIPVAGELSLKHRDGSRYHDYFPGLNITADFRRDVLHVRLHGGYYVYQHQKADLQFICDQDVEEPTNPITSWAWNGTHTFSWRTKHACGETVVTPTTSSEQTPTSDSGVPEPTSPPEENGPPDDSEPPDNEQNLIDPDVLAGRSRRSMMTIFICSASVVAILVYALYFPPRRLQHLVTSYVKTHPSLLRARVGERVLVRWADEDFVLDGGEEDVMVNADEQFDALDEQIPLKPSPRRSSVLTNYGSAR